MLKLIFGLKDSLSIIQITRSSNTNAPLNSHFWSLGLEGGDNSLGVLPKLWPEVFDHVV